VRDRAVRLRLGLEEVGDGGRAVRRSAGEVDGSRGVTFERAERGFRDFFFVGGFGPALDELALERGILPLRLGISFTALERSFTAFGSAKTSPRICGGNFSALPTLEFWLNFLSASAETTGAVTFTPRSLTSRQCSRTPRLWRCDSVATVPAKMNRGASARGRGRGEEVSDARRRTR
jgi:hypothetical protein